MKTILVVDDDESILSVLCMVLQHHGFRVLQATSAAAALELARGNQPDLIFTDMSMPGEDGTALLHHLRAHPQLVDCPVVVMTGDAGMVLPTTQPRADGLLIKPVSMAALLTCVRQHLKKAGEPQQA